MFDIGTRIRELHKLNKLTTKELGYKMNVHQSFISGLENNIKKCSMDNLFKLCEIFNITLSEFFNDDKFRSCNTYLWTQRTFKQC
ncbi:helix-turn-helix domain-containing protein [Clostridium sp. BJN0013]|uniref:helix-turn-helix domain-containing protein n=1 Tax=Clostridium sp. BJN0013 TaxID=3236840 RepID=UPI0034C6426A